MKLLLRLR
ncbi:unnamed protein product [Linum tenue]|uniref:Uncharacterized protein n=1 Tax=Linum tenue TaxID=586396 RepID=A0AAV0HVF4_9ROSI|nr:unnamed protein product [Linum tenue]CAI0388010.1 unnamed protein product [Linum tenue]